MLSDVQEMMRASNGCFRVRTSGARLSKDEARQIAANIAKLRDLLRERTKCSTCPRDGPPEITHFGR